MPAMPWPWYRAKLISNEKSPSNRPFFRELLRQPTKKASEMAALGLVMDINKEELPHPARISTTG